MTGALNGPPLRILVTKTPPNDAHVAVQYGRRWFWIADNDIQSKYTFAIVMLLFSIADTGVKGQRLSSRYPPISDHRAMGSTRQTHFAPPKIFPPLACCPDDARL